MEEAVEEPALIVGDACLPAVTKPEEVEAELGGSRVLEDEEPPDEGSFKVRADETEVERPFERPRRVPPPKVGDLFRWVVKFGLELDWVRDGPRFGRVGELVVVELNGVTIDRVGVPPPDCVKPEMGLPQLVQNLTDLGSSDLQFEQ
jgi:hypothetical protein